MVKTDRWQYTCHIIDTGGTLPLACEGLLESANGFLLSVPWFRLRQGESNGFRGWRTATSSPRTPPISPIPTISTTTPRGGRWFGGQWCVVVVRGQWSVVCLNKTPLGHFSGKFLNKKLRKVGDWVWWAGWSLVGCWRASGDSG